MDSWWPLGLSIESITCKPSYCPLPSKVDKMCTLRVPKRTEVCGQGGSALAIVNSRPPGPRIRGLPKCLVAPYRVISRYYHCNTQDRVIPFSGSLALSFAMLSPQVLRDIKSMIAARLSAAAGGGMSWRGQRERGPPKCPFLDSKDTTY